MTIRYKFNEDKILADIKEYIDCTYDQHYSQGKYQATDIIIDAGHGEGDHDSDQASDDIERANEAVGLLPGIVAGQRPRRADTQEKGFAGLRQIVADNDEQHPASGHDETDKLIGISGSTGAADHHQGDARRQCREQHHAAGPDRRIGLPTAPEVGLERVKIRRSGEQN